MRLFQKPKLDNTEYLKELEEKVFKKSHELENLTTVFDEKKSLLETEHSRQMEEKRVELDKLKDDIIGKKSERAYLEKPLIEKELILKERETNLNENEKRLINKEESLVKREKLAEDKISDVQDLLDQIGEKVTSINQRENRIVIKEKALSERENDYLVKIEQFNQKVAQSTQTLELRENNVKFLEVSLQGKEENLKQREKQLIQDKLLVQSQRQALISAKNDTKRTSE